MKCGQHGMVRVVQAGARSRLPPHRFGQIGRHVEQLGDMILDEAALPFIASEPHDGARANTRRS